MSTEVMKQALELCERMRDGREPWGRDELRKICIDLRAAIEQAERPQTHSEECWRWHHGCAVAKIERMQAQEK